MYRNISTRATNVAAIRKYWIVTKYEPKSIEVLPVFTYFCNAVIFKQ
jgi:hypothetical protein